MTFYRGTSDKTWEESQTTLNISPFEVGSDTHSGSILQQSQPQQHSTSLIDPRLTLSSSRITPLQSVAQASEQSLKKEIEKLAVATTYRDQRTSNGPARIERVVANQGGEYLHAKHAETIEETESNNTTIHDRQRRHREPEKIGERRDDLEQELTGYHSCDRLASGSDNGTIRIWDLATGRCSFTLKAHDGSVESMAWAQKDGWLASGSLDRSVKIFDPATGKCISTFKGHRQLIRFVVWIQDNSRLASGSLDKTIKIWDLATDQCVSTLKGHSSWVVSLAWTQKNSWLASGSFDYTVKIWDLVLNKCISTLQGHNAGVRSVVWIDNGRRLASGSFDTTIKIWDPTTGSVYQRSKPTITGSNPYPGHKTSYGWRQDHLIKQSISGIRYQGHVYQLSMETTWSSPRHGQIMDVGWHLGLQKTQSRSGIPKQASVY